MGLHEEVLTERELALQNLRSALESAVRSVANVRLLCDDVEALAASLRNNLQIAIEELIWLDD